MLQPRALGFLNPVDTWTRCLTIDLIDYVHVLVVYEMMSRVSNPGYVVSIIYGLTIIAMTTATPRPRGF